MRTTKNGVKPRTEKEIEKLKRRFRITSDGGTFYSRYRTINAAIKEADKRFTKGEPVSIIGDKYTWCRIGTRWYRLEEV